jgi:hypothetical protein
MPMAIPIAILPNTALIATIKTERVRVKPLAKPECLEFNLVMIEQIEISSFRCREWSCYMVILQKYYKAKR